MKVLLILSAAALAAVPASPTLVSPYYGVDGGQRWKVTCDNCSGGGGSASAVTVDGGYLAAYQGGAWTVGVNNFPATQAVTGTFWQATQPTTDNHTTAPAPLAVRLSDGTNFYTASGGAGGGGQASIALDGGSAGVMGWNGLAWVPVEVDDSASDGVATQATGLLDTDAHLRTFNGSTFDRVRGTIDGGVWTEVRATVASKAKVTATYPTYTDGTEQPVSQSTIGALRVSMLQHEFIFSTANTTTAQLAAGATFTGGCESIVSQPAYSMLVYSDQPGTLTINQYQDAACARVIASQSYTHLAAAGIARSGTLNGDYFKVTYQNTGAATTTQLVVESAFGDILPATQLNNLPMAVQEVSGTAVATAAAGVQKVGIVGNAGAAFDAANNGTAPTNVAVLGVQLQSSASATVGTAGQVGSLVAGLDHVLYTRPGGPVLFSGGVTAIAATLTQVVAAPAAGLSLYLTDITAVSDTATAGQMTFRYGTGTNCGTGTTTVLPNVSTVTTGKLPYPGNTAAYPSIINLSTPIKLPAANALCVICVATNTCTVSVGGFTAP